MTVHLFYSYLVDSSVSSPDLNSNKREDKNCWYFKQIVVPLVGATCFGSGRHDGTHVPLFGTILCYPACAGWGWVRESQHIK